MPVAKSAMRAVKNAAKGYTDAEVALRSATSNDSLPPSGKQLHDLARYSYDGMELPGMLEILDKRLNDKGKYWRHVYKSLVVVDYLLHSGAPSVASYFRQNIYLIKTLAEFQHIDDAGRDVGADVRARARDVVRLLQDPTRLEEARGRRRDMYDRMAGREPRRNSQADGERKRSAGEGLPPALPPRRREYDEEAELAKVLKMSEQEEAERRKRLEQANQGDLFDAIEPSLIDLDETPTVVPQPTIQPQFTTTSLHPQYTTYQVQPQYTLQPQFTVQPQHTSLQPQYTSIAPQWTSLSPQYTASAIQQQYTSAYDANAQQAQYENLLRHQQYAALQAQATASAAWEQPRALSPHHLTVGSNNPFGPRSISAPYPSNNPFATSPPPAHHPSSPTSSTSTASTSPPPRTPPSAALERSHARALSGEDDTLANPFTAHERRAYSAADAERRAYSAADVERMSKLERAYAERGEGDGLDTFGNVGQLRFGGSAFGRVAVQRTGGFGVGAQR